MVDTRVGRLAVQCEAAGMGYLCPSVDPVSAAGGDVPSGEDEAGHLAVRRVEQGLIGPEGVVLASDMDEHVRDVAPACGCASDDLGRSLRPGRMRRAPERGPSLSVQPGYGCSV